MASLRRWNSAPDDLIPPEFHRSETDPMLQQEEQVKKKRVNDSDVTALTTVSSSNTNARPEEAKKTKCHPGAGIVQDYKQTIRIHWKTEMKNLSPKTIAVGFFLFFACIAPAM